jgi:hypothetical protein
MTTDMEQDKLTSTNVVVKVQLSELFQLVLLGRTGHYFFGDCFPSFV